jgi:hypothetical protein
VVRFSEDDRTTIGDRREVDDVVAFLAQMREYVWMELPGLPPEMTTRPLRPLRSRRLAPQTNLGTDWPPSRSAHERGGAGRARRAG